jgi:hypothetical protein
LYKRRVLRQTADRHSLRVLVETGTYKGDTVAALRRRFDRIISIELSPIYAERARRRFAADANVSIIEGDSASVLWEVVDALREPALFWLDGHASGGETARGTAGSPVSTEVDVVLRSRYGHVVLIDDARCFDGSDGYPTLHDLRERVRDLGGGSLDLTVADDIIRLVPSERLHARSARWYHYLVHRAGSLRFARRHGLGDSLVGWRGHCRTRLNSST